MSTSGKAPVPVWTLTTTASARVPGILDQDAAITPERLDELRSALAAFADVPVVTLEAHPMPTQFNRAAGIPLDAASPLAKHLAELVTRTAHEAVPADATTTGEVLYRMVVPAKLAAQVGKGTVRPMRATTVAGGIYGDLRGARNVVAKAAFVPVKATDAAAAGAAGGAAGTAGVAAAGAGAMTVAAPLVLMAVAVGVSAHADRQRQLAIEHVTELLEQLHSDKLDAERSILNGCQDAIDKATSILLDTAELAHPSDSTPRSTPSIQQLHGRATV